MTKEWDLEDFIERLKAGEFDDHLIDTIGKLSTKELAEVAYILHEEESTKSRARAEMFGRGTVSPMCKEWIL